MSTVSIPAESWLRLDATLPPQLRYLVHTLADRPLDPATKFAGCAPLVTFEHNGFIAHAVLAVVGPGGAPPGFDPTDDNLRAAEDQVIARTRTGLFGRAEGSVVRRRPTAPAVEFVADLVLDELVRLRGVQPADPAQADAATRAFHWIRGLTLLTGWPPDEIDRRMTQRAADLAVERQPPPATKGGAA